MKLYSKILFVLIVAAFVAGACGAPNVSSYSCVGTTPAGNSFALKNIGDTKEFDGEIVVCTGKGSWSINKLQSDEAPVTAGNPSSPSQPDVLADGTPDCKNHGVTAWQNDNMSSGQTYGLAPVGGLSEPCWVVAQTHWIENGVEVRAVFAVEPNSVAWLIDYLGGTGWYFSGTESDVRANLAQQASELETRDGKMKTYVIVLPEDAEKFPILDHMQTNP